LQYGVIGAVVAIVLVVPWCLPRLSLLEATFLVIAPGCVACLSFWRIGWLGGRCHLHKVLWTSDGEWRMFGHAQDSWLATLHPSSQLMGSLVWLRFTSERGASQILLFDPRLTSDSRRLATRLRLQASGDAKKRRSSADNAGDLP
jgi:hypothetical protein